MLARVEAQVRAVGDAVELLAGGAGVCFPDAVEPGGRRVHAGISFFFFLKSACEDAHLSGEDSDENDKDDEGYGGDDNCCD